MVQLSDELVARLEAEASRRGCSRSAIVREALAEHLERASLQGDIERYIEAYRAMPQPDIDEWGDLQAMGRSSSSASLRALDLDEADGK